MVCTTVVVLRAAPHHDPLGAFPTFSLSPDELLADARVSALEPFVSSVGTDGGVRSDLVTPMRTMVELTLPAHAGTEVLEAVTARPDLGRAAIVEIHAQFDVPEAGTEDGPRFVAFFRRVPAMTPRQFWDHWTKRHVPLVLGAGPGFHRYRTGRVVAASFPTDGMVDQWFASDDDLERHHRSTRDKPEVVEDATRFVHEAESYLVRRVERGAAW